MVNKMIKCMNLPNFLWKIENFSTVQKKVCPAILIRGMKWQLTFSHFNESGIKKICLFLDFLSTSEIFATFLVKAEVNLVSYGEHRHLKSDIYTLEHKELRILSLSLDDIYKSYGKVIDITFLVKITPYGDVESSFKIQNIADKIDCNSHCIKSLTEDFERLFNNDEKSDFVLKCGDKIFNVHKVVLSARSSFFAGMFRSGMKEVNEGITKIENVEPDILELILRYLYTGKIPQLPMESLPKVYSAADRFDVEPLKIKCHSLFVDNFTNDFKSDFKDETKKEVPNVGNKTEVLESENIDNKTEGLESDSLANKEKEILKELFMTREWRILSQEFPHISEEMVKPFLLQKQ